MATTGSSRSRLTHNCRSGARTVSLNGQYARVRPSDLSMLSDADRDKGAAALDAAFSATDVRAVGPVAGGASGAHVYQVVTDDGDFLMRIEGPRRPYRNPHQYTCLSAAAAAGIAPPVRHLDADAGVVIMPFLETVPLTEFPGGTAAVTSAAADLLVDLHQLAPFPTFGDHLFDVGGVLTALRFSGRVRSDQLPAHQEMLEEIRAVYPWDPATFVSTHNDVNPTNLLYDGNRLWLIDWESAKRNDPFIDIAQVCVALATTAELEDLVLRRVLSSPPDDLVRARLLLAKQLVRLFTGAALVLVTSSPPEPVDLDAAMTMDEINAAVGRGHLAAGQPATFRAIGAALLRRAHDVSASPAGTRALTLLGQS